MYILCTVFFTLYSIDGVIRRVSLLQNVIYSTEFIIKNVYTYHVKIHYVITVKCSVLTNSKFNLLKSTDPPNDVTKPRRAVQCAYVRNLLCADLVF